MTFDWWTLGLQAVNAVVLVWLLARFLFRPVADIIAERQAAAQAVLGDAEAARAEAQAARDAARAASAEIAAERAALVAKALEEAEAEKARLIEAARRKAGEVEAEGAAELAHERRAQARELEAQAGVLAADIAARLVARLPDEARIHGFIDGLTEAVADLPDAVRAGIDAEGPVRIRAARTLTDAETAALTERLASVLGHAPTLAVEVDPDLLAGLELAAPHAVVRNSFRADLDRIAKELTGHD